MNISDTTHSAFIYPLFKYCTGTVSSAISVYFSHVDLLSHKMSRYINFQDNFSSEGTTVYSQGSEMIFDQIFMAGNFGNLGGCLNFASTEVVIKDCSFARNFANQGGVFFAI